MPPEDNTSTGDQSNDQQNEDKSLPTTLEGWQKLAEAREKRLRESEDRIKRLNGVNSTLDERIRAIEQAQTKRLAEQGNFQELAQQRAAEVEALKPVAERAAALEKVIRASNEARMVNIPDNKKNLVAPLIDVLPPEKLQEYLNANPDLFVKEPAADYDAGAGAGGRGGNGSGTPKLTAEEIETAKRSGMKPDEYAKAKAKLPQK
jgi:hypothetical protein